MIAPPEQPTPEDETPFFTSPDGQLALTVQTDVDGEVLVGFHGFDWNIQASQLADTRRIDAEQAVEQFMEEIMNDDHLIAVLKIEDDITDVWITELPDVDAELCQAEESIEFRYWSGKNFDT